MMKLKGIAWLMLLGILLLPGSAVRAQPDRKSSAEEKKLAEASGKMEEQRKQEAAKHEAGKGNEPKEEVVPVPAGEFFMGCNEQVDTECNNDEKPGRRVYVKAFKIDKTEVTVAQYRQCVEAGACNGDGLTMPFWAGADNEEHPEWAWACNWSKAERESHTHQLSHLGASTSLLCMGREAVADRGGVGESSARDGRAKISVG